MIKPNVSIIVPFYNPKNYFNELLASISNQSYQNIEVILVDDGSDVIYNNIARTFVESHENRILITKKNGGVASARQAGLEASTGEFIIHADADDILPESAIESLVKIMLINNADIVVGGFTIKYKKKDKYVGVDNNESYWGFVEGLIDSKYHGSLCNKLIRKELYSSSSFEPNLNYMEDKLILAKILSLGPYNISYLNEPVYIYRQNSESATYKLSMDSIVSYVAVTDKIIDLYKGVLKDEIIDRAAKNKRVFEIFQNAKKEKNIFSNEDIYLISDDDVPLKFRLVLCLLKRDFMSAVKFILKFNAKFLVKLY